MFLIPVSATDGIVGYTVSEGTTMGQEERLILDGGFMDAGGTTHVGDVLGEPTVLQTAANGCVRVFNGLGSAESCDTDTILEGFFMGPGRGHVAMLRVSTAVQLDGLELDDDQTGDTTEGSLCDASTCVIGIPTEGGSGSLWTMQKGQRADSAPIRWSPENGVERV